MDALDRLPFAHVTAIDFEFSAPPGERPEVCCLVARDLRSGATRRCFQDELAALDRPPYPIGPDALIVAYYASAEMGCHLALNWPLPVNVLDLFVEFRAISNGQPPLPGGAGLLGALTWYGLDGIDAIEKQEMRDLARRGGPYTAVERQALLPYCETDVIALARLLPRMLPSLDLPRTLLRGRYMKAAACIEQTGIPIDRTALAVLQPDCHVLLPRLIRLRDAPFYMGMDRNRFNAEVRPYVTQIPIGEQGIAFDRIELDAWVEQYKSRNGRPGQPKGETTWDAKRYRGSTSAVASGTSTNRSGGGEFAKALATDSLEEAERFLARLMEETRQAEIYGVRPSRTFEQAAAKFVLENQHKRSLASDIGRLKLLMPWIGNVSLGRIHTGTLQFWIDQRRKEGAAAGTINHGLKVVRHILNLAAGEWVDEYGLTWLAVAPKIKLLPDTHKRQPYPLSWDEQSRLFKELPAHLAEMALFAVNTGCRDAEICQLRWDWEVKVPALEVSVFIIPGQYVKNGDERLVILNRVALSVVNAVRGRHPTHVFNYRGKPVTRMLNSVWLRARKAAGLPQVRVHDLKHTFGRRLRAAGVSFEDRQDLLGHRSGRITTHYSAAELSRLIEAANSICDGRNQNSASEREWVPLPLSQGLG